MPVVAHGIDNVTDRALFSLSVPSVDELPAQLDLGSPHFVCFLAWDARQASNEAILAVATHLLSLGASYFVCWGPDCRRVHDIIDQVASDSETLVGVPLDWCIMTTWHESETIDEALRFFLVDAWPDDHFLNSTRAALAVSVGSYKLKLTISSALHNVRGFIHRVSDSDVA